MLQPSHHHEGSRSVHRQGKTAAKESHAIGPHARACMRRIPLATSHPQLPGWVGNKPLLLVLNRVDMVSAADQATWTAYFRDREQPVLWTDAKLGTGVKKVGLL